MLLKIFLLFSVIFVALEAKGYLLPHCQLPLHLGTQNCKNSSSIRFHMDPESEKCLAFKYSGCGGNANNFGSFGDCLRCFAADYSGCPMGSKPVPNSDNSSICGTFQQQNCTSSSAYCKSGAFFGTCCDVKIRDKLKADEDKDQGCLPKFQKAIYTTHYGAKIALLGKNCDSKFCPEKSTCHQGNYFAYCCSA